MGKHPYNLFLLFSVFIFVCLFCFVFHETGLLALRLFPILANQGMSRRQTRGLWPIKNGRPRGIKDFLTTLGVTTGWWLHPTIRKWLTGGVTLHSISTKGSEWVSEVEIECLTLKVSAVEWASLTQLRVPSQRNCCVNQSSYVLCSRYTYNVYCVMQIINFIWSSCS